MEEIRQQEYLCNIPPARPQQTHQENEEAEEFKTDYSNPGFKNSLTVIVLK